MLLNRRQVLRMGVLGCAAPFINRGSFQLFAESRATYSARTIDLVQQSTVIDMLGLLTMNWNQLHSWQAQPGTFTEADWRKLQNSGITVFHPAVELISPDPYKTNLGLIQDWNGFISRYPKYLMRVDGPADVEAAKRSGRVGVVLGFQNSDHFRSSADVQQFASLGQRVSQLTYNARNEIGYGCTAAHDEGLTEFGGAIVKAMNESGIAIDVSHSGDRTTMDALDQSKKPVLITHSNCRALSPHPRCKPDEIIKKMGNTGGVMGITGIRAFVGGKATATLNDDLDHFAHVIRLTGIEHAGIGSDTDLDGRDPGRQHLDVEGLDQPQRIFNLTEGLVRRGYTNEHIRLILGGNFERVLKQIWIA